MKGKIVSIIMSTDIKADVIDNIKNGQIFSVTFYKKDGSLRKMNCRKGVVKYLKGNDTRKPTKNKNLVTVYDMHKKNYRSFDVSTVTEVRYGGTTFYTLGGLNDLIANF